MIGVTESLPSRLRRAVGLRLRTRREELGLKRSAVARHCGYHNVSKGSRRIADWETGDMGPLLDESKYFELLRISETSIQAELRRARQIHTRIERLGYDSMAAERRLLRANAACFRDNTKMILGDPNLSGVRTPAAALSMLWVGGGPIPLGNLVAAWKAGALVADTDDHGPVYLYAGSGSPLSGAGSCVGVDQAGAARSISRSPSRFFRGHTPEQWRRKLPPSGKSLADAVVDLGGTAPRTHVYLLDQNAVPEEGPIILYNPVKRELELASGLDIDPVVGTSADLRERLIFGGVSVGGGPARPMSIGGLQLGGYRSAEVVHSCGLRTGGGRVRGEGGWFPVKVTGPSPPPSVLPVLAHILTLVQDKGNSS